MFNPQIMTGSPSAGALNKGGMGENELFSSYMRRYLENGMRHDQIYYQ